ncbi:eap30 family protein [Nannochloropsis oceanica]
MRRGVGVKYIKRKEIVTEAFTTLGKELQEENIQHVASLMATFKDSLEDFARKYKKDINANPVLRAEFHKMCTSIGVDPLASNKGLWTQLLGVGDFYYELAVQVIEICLITRPLNGGLISLPDLTQRVRVRRKLDQISQDDIKTAIRKVHLLGAGFSVLKSGRTILVVSVPLELSSDHSTILEVAQGKASHVSMSQIITQLKWEEQRVKIALDLMMQGGMVWVDEQGGKEGGTEGEPVYWFPSLWQQERMEEAEGEGE